MQLHLEWGEKIRLRFEIKKEWSKEGKKNNSSRALIALRDEEEGWQLRFEEV